MPLVVFLSLGGWDVADGFEQAVVVEPGNLRQPLLVLIAVPLAMLGGLAALHLRGITINVSSAVGFIALFGVAVLNGVLMIGQINRLRSIEGKPLRDAVIEAAVSRIRPVLTTATVAAFGLMPAMLTLGPGIDVQRPLATVVVVGLVTATLLTLVLLPALYQIMEARADNNARRRAQSDFQHLPGSQEPA